MFNPFRQEDPALDAAITSVFKEMTTLTSDDPEYAKMVEQLPKLYALKNEKQVDPNTVLTVVGNLAIAILVVKFERTDVITTKLFSFLAKR